MSETPSTEGRVVTLRKAPPRRLAAASVGAVAVTEQEQKGRVSLMRRRVAQQESARLTDVGEEGLDGGGDARDDRGEGREGVTRGRSTKASEETTEETSLLLLLGNGGSDDRRGGEDGGEGGGSKTHLDGGEWAEGWEGEW